MRPRPHQIWLALWIAFCLFLVVRTGIRDRGVIIDHIEFGRRLISGEHLYEPYLDPPRPLHPVYPPSFGVLTAPYALLGERAARFAWGLTQVLALTAIGAVLIDVLRRARNAITSPPPPEPNQFALVAFVTFLLTSRYVLRDTHGGGGNTINLALALCAWHRADAGRPIQSGLLLGLSLATKPTTVLFVPMLAAFGRVRAAAASLLVAAGIAIASVLMQCRGLDDWSRWVRGSMAYGAQTDLYATPAFGFPPFTWMNQSLRPAVQRYLGEVPPQFAGEIEGGWWFDGLGLDATWTLWIYRVLVATGLVIALVHAVRAHGSRARQLVAFAGFAALSLLLSPLSWKAHHVALIPAAFLVAAHAVLGPRRTAAWVLAGLYAAACLLGEELVGKDFKNVQQSLYLTTFGTLAIWGFVATRGLEPLMPTTGEEPAVRADESREAMPT